MIVLLIILAVLVLICLIRIRIILAYGGDGASVVVRVGFIKYTVFPQKPKKAKKKQTKKKSKEKAEKGLEETRGGSVEKFKGYLKLVTDATKKLRRSLRIDLLRIHYTVAGTDAAATAMSYGRACAYVSALLPGFHALFKIKTQDIQVEADFNAESVNIYAEGTISIRIGELIYIGLSLALQFWELRRTGSKRTYQKKGGV